MVVVHFHLFDNTRYNEHMISNFVTAFKTGGSYSIDIVVLIILFFIFFAYAAYFGKSRLVSFILAFYPAIFFYEHFPFSDKLMVLHGSVANVDLVVANKVLIFLAFLIPISILIARFIFAESGFGETHHARNAGYALVAVAIVLIFTHGVVNLDSLYNFSPRLDSWFAGSVSLFWWEIGTLAALFFL
jgi:hypothetical protein